MEDIDSPGKKSIIQPVSQDDKRRLIRGACFLAILVGLTIWLALLGHLQPIINRIIYGFESKEHMRTYLKAWGAWAPIVFIALQALQVIVAPIPGELTGVVGGFLFGTWRAVAYSSLGLTLGSAIAFLLARLIGLPFVKLFVPPTYVEKLDFWLNLRV